MKIIPVLILAIFCVAANGQRRAEITETLLLNATDVASNSSGGQLGDYYTFDIVLPTGIRSGDVVSAVLEVYANVSANPISGWVNDAPLVEMYALKADYTGTLNQSAFRKPSSMIRSVPIGDNKLVRIDITAVVKTLIDEPENNHGFVLGSFRGAREGVFELLDSKFANNNIIQITLYCVEMPGR